jgi:gas vesicle protein
MPTTYAVCAGFGNLFNLHKKFTTMNYKKTLTGFAAGAAVGVLAGILLAPDKGSATRKKISNKTNDLSDSVKHSFSDFIDSVKRLYKDAEQNVDDMEDIAIAKMNGLKAEAKQKIDNSFAKS